MKHAWIWHVTMQFQNGTTAAQAEYVLKVWLKRLKEAERLQIAGIAIFNNQTIPHIHCLLTEQTTPYTKSLIDIDSTTYSISREGGPASMVITSAIEWTSAAARYLTKEKNMALYQPDGWQLISIRPALLEKLKLHA